MYGSDGLATQAATVRLTSEDWPPEDSVSPLSSPQDFTADRQQTQRGLGYSSVTGSSLRLEALAQPPSHDQGTHARFIADIQNGNYCLQTASLGKVPGTYEEKLVAWPLFSPLTKSDGSSRKPPGHTQLCDRHLGPSGWFPDQVPKEGLTMCNHVQTSQQAFERYFAATANTVPSNARQTTILPLGSGARQRSGRSYSTQLGDRGPAKALRMSPCHSSDHRRSMPPPPRPALRLPRDFDSRPIARVVPLQGASRTFSVGTSEQGVPSGSLYQSSGDSSASGSLGLRTTIPGESLPPLGQTSYSSSKQMQATQLNADESDPEDLAQD